MFGDTEHVIQMDFPKAVAEDSKIEPSRLIAGERVTMRDMFERPEYVEELKEISDIMDEIHRQIHERMYNTRAKPFGVMLDRATHRKLMTSVGLVHSGQVVPQHYAYDVDYGRILGLMVSIVDSNKDKQFIKVVS